jgi:glycosyltransferase involved in cell wall biosynthesis
MKTKKLTLLALLAAAAMILSYIESLLPGGDDVEILIVNDGSKDRTAEIADSYQAKYPGICKAIHQENGGLGAARNTGIEAARGEYLFFLDSDDVVDAKAVLETATEARERKLDVMKAGFCCFDDETGERTGGPQLPGTADLPARSCLRTSAGQGFTNPWSGSAYTGGAICGSGASG